MSEIPEWRKAKAVLEMKTSDFQRMSDLITSYEQIPYDIADLKSLQEIRQGLSVIFAKLSVYAGVLKDNNRKYEFVYKARLAKLQEKFRLEGLSPNESRAAAQNSTVKEHKDSLEADSSEGQCKRMLEGLKEVLNSISSHIRSCEDVKIRTNQMEQV